MSKRVVWLMLLTLLVALVVSGCAPAAGEATPAAEEEVAPAEEEMAPEEEAAPAEEEAPAEEMITVGAVLFGVDSFFENIQTGMETAAEDAGVELLVSVHDHDIAQETEYIEDYVARGVDAIVITPESLDASVAAIREAYDAGVTIVCFNTCLNEDDTANYVSAFYETDQSSLGYQTGEYLVEWVAENMPDADINIGILQCDRFEACARRGEGFRQALSDGGLEWTEVDNQEGFMPDVGSDVAESMLQAHPEINILWSENEGGTVGEVIAVRTMGLQDSVFVFGTDISPQLAEMLLADDNVLQAVTGQSPRLMGHDSVMAAIDIVSGEAAPGYNVVPNAFYSRSDLDAVQTYMDEY
jgi:ABC-type sugar transport system substrate-binding protein